MWGARDFEHRRALAALNAMEYGDELPKRISAYATMFNIFDWNGVVETDSDYRAMPVNSLTPEVDPRREVRIFHKPPETPVLEAAKQSYLGRVFLDWADYPFFEARPLVRGEEIGPQSSAAPKLIILRTSFQELPEQQGPAPEAPYGYEVRMFDLRYFDVASALRSRRRILGGIVQLDRDLHPVAYYMASFFGNNEERARQSRPR
jgi:hypothetical protein